MLTLSVTINSVEERWVVWSTCCAAEFEFVGKLNRYLPAFVLGQDATRHTFNHMHIFFHSIFGGRLNMAFLEKQRDVTESAIDRTAKKRLEKQEERFKNINRELSMVKMKSMFAVGLIFTSLFNVFSSMFDGRVVAKLPFVPFSWIQGLSHRNLPGSDFTDASFVFVYILCTMSIRQNVQKILGFAPSRSFNKQSTGFAQS
ncbi:unnamed protein product [Schistosoma bovis]|nr:unnamed protein product [Schistosoma bovis]